MPTLQNKYLHAAEPFLRSQVTETVKKMLPLLEHNDSSPCSQKPATGTYTEPDESQQHKLNVSIQQRPS
jgi:hypothetical protein